MGASRPTRLREAHAHLAATGRALSLPSAADCADLPALLALVEQSCARAPVGQLVQIASVNANRYPQGRWPTLNELDGACRGRACVLLSFDHHTAMASSAALALAGLKPGPFGAVGVVDADEQGQPTGLLHEDAAWHAWNCAPEPDESQRSALVAAALSALAKLGYVEVHDLHSQPWLGRVLRQLESAGQLACDVWLYPNVNDLDAVASDRASFESSRIRLAGGKLFADGTLSSRTAHMIHRYVDPLPDAPRGRCMVSPMQIDQAIAKCDSLGLALATHAIGDGAVRDVLDAIERVAPKSRGFRVEHAELIDRADVPRFVELGVTCSVQPCHLLSDIEALNRSLCHRLPRVLPLRELIDSGLIPGHMGLDGRAGLVFGSDVPIVRADPGDSIQAAVHRRRFGAPMEEAIAIKQAISEEEAWACFALN